MDEESLNNLSKSVNDAFFECLESAMGCTILPEIRNILQFNYYNNAITISKIDENALREMEEVMRHDFQIDMVPEDDASLYLCRFKNNQKNFKLIGGQKRLILEMADFCSKLSNKKITLNRNITRRQTEDSDHTMETAEPSVTNADIHEMMKELNKWIVSRPALAEISKENLVLKVIKNSITLNRDGSLSCTMPCPVTTCKHRFTATRKAYPTYKTLKKPKPAGELQKPAASKWYMSGLKDHLTKIHSNRIHEDSENSEAESSDQRPTDNGDQSRTDNGDQSRIDNGDQSRTDNGGQSPIDNNDQSRTDNGGQSPIDNNDQSRTDNGDQSRTDNGGQSPIDNNDQSRTDNGGQSPIDNNDQIRIDNGDQGPIDNGGQSQIENGDQTDGTDVEFIGFGQIEISKLVQSKHKKITKIVSKNAGTRKRKRAEGIRSLGDQSDASAHGKRPKQSK